MSFECRRNADSDTGGVTSSGRSFQICGPTTGKARLPTVDRLTGSSNTRRLASTERRERRPGVDVAIGDYEKHDRQRGTRDVIGALGEFATFQLTAHTSYDSRLLRLHGGRDEVSRMNTRHCFASRLTSDRSLHLCRKLRLSNEHRVIALAFCRD